MQEENVGFSTACTSKKYKLCQMCEVWSETCRCALQGVFLTLEARPSGQNVLRRIRFPRGRFSKEQAAAWWSANKAEVVQRCNLISVRPAEVDFPQQDASPTRCRLYHWARPPLGNTCAVQTLHALHLSPSDACSYIYPHIYPHLTLSPTRVWACGVADEG